MTKNTTAVYPTASEAIAFALDCLEPFEVTEYLQAWTSGDDLTPWAIAYMEDRGLQSSDSDINVTVSTTGRDINERRADNGEDHPQGIP